MQFTRRQALASFGAAAARHAASSEHYGMINAFQIPDDPSIWPDLQRRLATTRWTDAVTADWSYGTERTFLQNFIDHWRDRYDWTSRREALNALPHFRTTIDGYGVHFLHFRGKGHSAIPLLLMNGWPSSFAEYQKLAPLLANGDPSFDVVLPALPGFGFSGHPKRPYEVEPADLYPKLMARLGYERFLAAGTDIGSGVATRIALRHPDRVRGIHVSAVASKPRKPDEAPPTPEEVAYQERGAIWDRDEGGYQAIQSSRPQTLAFGLADSPVGLASWIVEKFRAWSDCEGDLLSVFPADALIDNLMIYWVSNTIGSSVRYYYEAVRLRPPLRPNDFVEAPTAIGMWPRDIAVAPRSLAERLYNVQRYTVFPRGGHFPAWEAPDLYAADLRAFAASLPV